MKKKLKKLNIKKYPVRMRWFEAGDYLRDMFDKINEIIDYLNDK